MTIQIQIYVVTKAIQQVEPPRGASAKQHNGDNDVHDIDNQSTLQYKKLLILFILWVLPFLPNT